MKKRLFIVSVDAMVREDVEYLKTRPNFGRYMKNACEITHMRTIAPTITYPVHSAMISGCYPEKTGILNNDGFAIGNNGKKWLWFAKAKQCDDLFFEAKKAGYSTASICWPVTGCHPAIDYLIDEYWMQGPKSTLKGTYRDVGSSDEVLSIIEHNKNQLPEGWEKPRKANFTRQPWFDNFLDANACEIIRRYTPELVAIHLNYVDGTRHEMGVFNSQVTHVLDLVDMWIGSLMHALEESGVLSDTNIVITSDHGQMDIKRVMKPNVFLADHDYITLNEDGLVKSWKAYAFSGGMNAYVVMKDRKTNPHGRPCMTCSFRWQTRESTGSRRCLLARKSKNRNMLMGRFLSTLKRMDSLLSATVVSGQWLSTRLMPPITAVVKRRMGISLTRGHSRFFWQSDLISKKMSLSNEGRLLTWLLLGRSFSAFLFQRQMEDLFLHS